MNAISHLVAVKVQLTVVKEIGPYYGWEEVETCRLNNYDILLSVTVLSRNT